jgi:Leucine rich repeat
MYLQFTKVFPIIYYFRLYIALLGKVWSAKNNQSGFACSEDKHYCIFTNVYTNIDKFCDQLIVNFWSIKVLEFTNSAFERFPAPVCLPEYFVNVKTLQASDCGMSKLGDTFMKNLTKNQMWDLIEVDFSQNRLSEVEPLDRLPNLHYLNLSSNRIEELRNGSFAGFKNLQFLDLGSNNISKIDSKLFQQ